jgi:NTP pyrophosphatase (non-canonical NTP hydrolase)
MEKFDSYQTATQRTAPTDWLKTERMCNAILGLCGEAGELANKYKKMQFHGHDFDHAVLIDEAGDCLWYISELCSAMNVPLSDCAYENIQKLKRRYPEGFTQEASRNRIE